MVAGLVAVAMVGVACSSGGGGSSNNNNGGNVTKGGTLRIGTSSTIDTLNPFTAFQANAILVFLYEYPYLAQYDNKNEIVPEFATSWDTSSDANFRALVGWGSTGTWDSLGPNGAAIASAASGCYGTSGIPVHTSYQFFDDGNEVNRILVRRRISFGTTPFGYDLRAYIPRLYPRDQYSLVTHPNAAGTDLVTEIGNDCEFGCEVTNWNGTWFAVHDPVSGHGMIVRHASSSNPVALWVDMDGGSQTTASGVLLLQPPGGFTGTVVETESFCFYDSSIWTPGLTPPAGC